jgi:hypothetical protein
MLYERPGMANKQRGIGGGPRIFVASTGLVTLVLMVLSGVERGRVLLTGPGTHAASSTDDKFHRNAQLQRSIAPKCAGLPTQNRNLFVHHWLRLDYASRAQKCDWGVRFRAEGIDQFIHNGMTLYTAAQNKRGGSR